MSLTKGKTVKEAIRKSLNKQNLPNVNLPQFPARGAPSLNCLSVVSQLQRLERELTLAANDAQHLNAAMRQLGDEQLAMMGRAALDVGALAAAPLRMLRVARQLNGAARLLQMGRAASLGSQIANTGAALAFVFGVHDLPARIRRLNESDQEMRRLKHGFFALIRTVDRLQQDIERLGRFYEENDCASTQLRGRLD